MKTVIIARMAMKRKSGQVAPPTVSTFYPDSLKKRVTPVNRDNLLRRKASQ